MKYLLPVLFNIIFILDVTYDYDKWSYTWLVLASVSLICVLISELKDSILGFEKRQAKRFNKILDIIEEKIN